MHHHCCAFDTCDVSLDIAQAYALTTIRTSTAIRIPEGRQPVGVTSPGGSNAK
jgi:hypothetical protein